MFSLLRRRVLALLAVTLLLLSTLSAVAAQNASLDATPAPGGLAGAVAWLTAQQGENGAFAGFTGEPDAGFTVDAIQALAAAREAGVETADAIERAVAYLASDEVALVYVQTGEVQAAKMVLALHAAGENPLDFAGVQPLTIVERGLNEETGLYGAGMYDHILAVMALVVTNTEVPAEAIAAFEAYQADNGGWAFDGATDSALTDTNTTALAIQALVAAGEGDSAVVDDAISHLESWTTESGTRFSNADWAANPDANSTALVMQALLAAGADYATQANALMTFQNPSGAFHVNQDDLSDNLFSTIQAIPALAEVVYPIPSPALGSSAGQVAA